jgi:HEAT repeat protein
VRLREIALHDEEPFVRSWAIGALGEIGDPEGVDLLVPLLRDSSWRVRGGAAIALGRLSDARALRPLREARRRLRRSPLEWWIYRRGYNEAIEALEK